MSKAKAVRDALDECANDEWKCLTCDAPAEEHGRHCMSCRMYWDDVASGLFNSEPLGADFERVYDENAERLYEK